MCREFKILPNDPRLKDLRAPQIAWVLANMQEDQKEMAAAMGTDKPAGRKEYKALGGLA